MNLKFIFSVGYLVLAGWLVFGYLMPYLQNALGEFGSVFSGVILFILLVILGKTYGVLRI